MAAFADGVPEAPTLSTERMKELRAVCLVLVNRSILTLWAVPDPDARFRRAPSCSMPEHAPARFEIDFEELLRISRGETSGSAFHFRPTPKDLGRYLEVLDWLKSLSAQPGGMRDVKLLFARAHHIPWWRLSQQFGKAEITLKRWHCGAIEALTCRFWKEIDRLA